MPGKAANNGTKKKGKPGAAAGKAAWKPKESAAQAEPASVARELTEKEKIYKYREGKAINAAEKYAEKQKKQQLKSRAENYHGPKTMGRGAENDRVEVKGRVLHTNANKGGGTRRRRD